MAFWRKLAAIRAQKKGLEVHLRQHQRCARKGYWILPESVIARHLSITRIPKSLRSTKGVGKSSYAPIRRVLLRILYAIVPPVVVMVAKEKPEAALGSEFGIFVSARGGDGILINPDRGEVLRVKRKGSRIDDGQLEMRKRLGRFLLVPKACVIAGGSGIKEEYVNGRPLRCLGTNVRRRIVDQLVRRYEEMSETDVEYPGGEFWDGVMASESALRLSAETKQSMEEARVDLCGLFQKLPFTPAHGDLGGNNVIVTDRGPTLIDLEDCALLPVYFDIFFLSHQEWLAGRRDLWEHFVNGPGWTRIGRVLEKHLIGDCMVSRRAWIFGSFLVECSQWRIKPGSQLLDASTMEKSWLPVQGAIGRVDANVD